MERNLFCFQGDGLETDTISTPLFLRWHCKENCLKPTNRFKQPDYFRPEGGRSEVFVLARISPKQIYRRNTGLMKEKLGIV